MKKVTSTLVCLILLAVVLTGCNSKTKLYNDMSSLTKEISQLSEYEFAYSFNLTQGTGMSDEDYTAELEEINLKGIDIAGTVARDDNQAEMTFDFMTAESNTSRLTDIVLIGDKMYYNMADLISGILKYYAGNNATTEAYYASLIETLLDGNDYIEGNYTGSWDTEDSSELTTLLSDLSDTIYNSLKGLDAISKTDNTYTVTLSGSDLKTVLTAVGTHLSENSEAYATAITDVISEANADLEAIYTLPTQAELEESISDLVDDFNEDIDSEEELPISITYSIDYDKSNSTYHQLLIVDIENSLSLSVDMTTTATEIEEITAPSNFITEEDFEDSAGSLSDIISNSIFGEYGIGGSGATNFSYDTETSESMQPFLNKDLGAYEHFNGYDIQGSSGDTYSVPLINSDNVKTYMGTVGSESTGMWQYIITYDKGTETAESFLDWYVSDDYSQGYSDASNSNMIVSEDGKVAAMSFSYTDADLGAVTMIYIAQVAENGIDMVLIDLDLYYDYMDETDYTILSELSEIIGLTLSDLYTPPSSEI